MSSVLLEARAFRPFKSSEEYLYAMKEDLAEWLQIMYPHLGINVDNFMDKLETGVALCEHANAVKLQAQEYVEKKQERQAKKIMSKSVTGSLAQAQILTKFLDVKYFVTAKAGTFFARDNVSNFIHWCRICLQIIECLLFETDDLIMRKNEKHVILCLLEVARQGAKFGMLAPMLVQMERQIDREIAADQKKMAVSFCEGNENDNIIEDEDSDSDLEDEDPVLMYGPTPQIVTNDLKSLDEMVRDLVAKCTCPTQFPMIRVSEGKYRIGDTKVLIFVRILRNHVMVRVGGGWDTLSHYLDKHDPCRCRSQHRTTQGARLINKPGAADLHGSQVHYDRSAQAQQASQNGPQNGTANSNNHLGPPMNSLNRSRSKSPSHYSLTDSRRASQSPQLPRKSLTNNTNGRSRSPIPHYVSTHSAKIQTRESPAKTVTSSSPKHNPTSPYVSTSIKNGKSVISSLQIPLEKTKDSPTVLKSEANLQITADNLTDHSDTTSEMSDEGYRSLGLVQDKSKQRSSIYSQNSVEDAEENGHKLDFDDDLNDMGLRKTQYSQKIFEKDLKKPKKTEILVNTPEKIEKPTQIRRKERSFSSCRASSIDRGDFHTPQKGGSPKYLSPSHQVTRKLSNGNLNNQKDNSKINTWNGRQKTPRGSLTNEMFATPQFHRNSIGRRSVSAVCYDRRSSSANTSPTKTRGPRLRDELLNAVQSTEDDSIIAIHVQELLKKYGSLNILTQEDEEQHRNNIKNDPFKRNEERMSFRSPRKDSKSNLGYTKIPAPVAPQNA